MNAINWHIPPSTTRWIAKTPVHEPVAVLLRHSVRNHLPTGEAGYALPMVPKQGRMGRPRETDAREVFNLAEAWGLRKDGANPCRFVEKCKEHKRERFLTEDEFRRLGQVLSEVEAEGSETLSAVTAIRLLMLTGCRLSEIQTLRWENVDLEAGEPRLPDSKIGARIQLCLARAGAGREPADDREAARPHAGSDDGAIRSLGAELGEGVRFQDRRQHRRGYSDRRCGIGCDSSPYRGTRRVPRLVRASGNVSNYVSARGTPCG